MSWTKDTLLSKSKIFFEKAFQEEKESIFFGLMCAMWLEMLARAALANISPTLLAEPDKSQENLLYALNLADKWKSITASQVFALCAKLIPKFTDQHQKSALAIVNRRNEEVHTGTAAFMEYKTHQWIKGFYKCANVLTSSLDETLESIFGIEEAKVAQFILKETEDQTTQQTHILIIEHRKIFNEKNEEERRQLQTDAEKQGEILAHKKHHKVICPACMCTATVTGDTYGKDQVENREDEIIVRQTVIPTQFSCIACGLRLNNYETLSIAGVAEHFTHRIIYSPEAYYDLISPDDIEEAFNRKMKEDYYSSFSND